LVLLFKSPAKNQVDIGETDARFFSFPVAFAMGAPGQRGNIGGMLAQSNLMTDPSEGLEGFGIFSPRLREKLIEKEQMREHFPSMRSIDNFPQMQMFGNNKNGYEVRF
jgi:hypothetical protein